RPVRRRGSLLGLLGSGGLDAAGVRRGHGAGAHGAALGVDAADAAGLADGGAAPCAGDGEGVGLSGADGGEAGGAVRPVLVEPVVKLPGEVVAGSREAA